MTKHLTIFSFFIFLFSNMSVAQPTFIEILEDKKPYFALLSQLEQQEEKAMGIKISQRITIGGDMVVMELLGEKSYHCELRYWRGEFYSIYNKHEERSSFIRAVKLDSSRSFQPPAYWQDATVLKYLAIASEIAALGASGGNDYFSELLINEDEIKITQSNWHNAKLLGASSYAMWDLHFFIPLHKAKTRDMFDSYWIGDMMVYFRDNSKPKNEVGAAVLAKIKLAAEKYKNQ